MLENNGEYIHFYYRIRTVLTCLFLLAQICIVIWGSVLVFGKFIYSITMWKSNYSYRIITIHCDVLLSITYFAKIGNYASWTYDDDNKDEYCGYRPFMYSFGMLILGWMTFPFLLCYCCTQNLRCLGWCCLMLGCFCLDKFGGGLRPKH